MNSFGIPIGFSNLEIESMWAMASSRQDVKARYGVKTKRIDRKLSEAELHYLGIKGECAVAKLIGGAIDRKHTPSGDGGVDLVYRGLTVDVKYSQKDIKFLLGDSPASDILILVQPLSRTTKYGPYMARAERDPYVKKPVVAWKNALVVGWISRDGFALKSKVKKIGSFDRRVLEAHNMQRMDALLPYALYRSRGLQ